MTNAASNHSTPRFDARWLGEVLALAAFYFATARLGLLLAIPGGHVTPVWPPSGIALAAMLLRGRRVWPGIWLGSFAANFWDFYGSPMSLVTELSTSVVFGLGASLTALAGAHLLRRFVGGRNPLERVRDVCAFLALGGVVSCLVSATIGVTTLCLAGFAPWSGYGQTWLTWWLGDTAGVFVVAPLWLVWGGARWLKSAARWVELFACFGLLFAVTFYIFIENATVLFTGRPLTFILIPFLVWPAVRFGRRGAAVAAGLIALLAVWGTIHDSGPFHGGPRNEALLLLELFLGVVVLTALCMAAMATERERAEAAQQRAMDELETRVQQRTAALMQSEAQARGHLAEAERARAALLSILEDERRTEAALRASEANYRTLVESASDAILVTDAQGRLLDVNAVACRMFGYAREEMLTLSGTDIVAMSEAACVAPELARLNAVEVAQSEWQCRRKDGTLFPCEASATVLPDGRVLAILRDITGRKQAEAEVQKTFSTLQLFIDSVPHFIAYVDAEERYQLVNRNFEEWFGRPREQILGRTLREIHRPATYATMVPHLREVMAGRPISYENRMTGRDGKEYYFDVRYVPRRSPDGPVLGYFVLALDVTAHKQSAAALRESHTFYHSLVNQLPAGVFRKDAAGRYVFVSPWFCRLKGLKAEEFLGKTPREVAATMAVQPDATRQVTQHAAEGDEHHRQIMATGKPIEQVEEYATADGQKQFVHVIKIPVIDPDGKVIGTQGILSDITESKRTEAHIRHLNRIYAVLSDINQTIVHERDPQAMFAAACRIAVEKGRFRMAWIGRVEASTGWLKIAAHAGGSDDTVKILHALLGGEKGGCDCAFTACALKTGQHGVCNDIAHDPLAAAWRESALQRDYRAMASLPLKSGEKVIGIFNLYADTPGFFDADELRLLDELSADISFALEVSRRETKREEAEAARDALLVLETNLSAARVPLEVARSIFAAADKLWNVDAGTLNVYLPEQDLMQAVLNFDVIEGKRQDVRLVEFIGKPTPRLRRVMQQGAELVLRPTPVTPQPDHILFGDTARPSAAMMHVPIRWQGRAVGILSVQSYTANAFTDEDLRTLQGLADHCGGALERIRADGALRASEERFQELAGNINEVFWITDAAKQQMLYISPAYEKIWGRTCASLYAAPRTWLEAIHPEDRARIMAAAETKQAHGDYDETYRIQRPDGTVRWIHDRAFPVRGAAGEILRVVGTAEDITEQRQLEAQFRQSQKMEAIGQLAGGVAHDFNNILAAIMMEAELVGTTENLPPDAREYLAGIKASAERAANLTRQLLAFSRRQVMQPRQLDLNEIVAHLAKMLQRILGEDVRLQLNLHPRALLTRADAGMLDQVLLNLVVNARDAMPGGGQLVIETGEKNFTAVETALLPDAKPGRHVSLRVTDTGSGIAPGNLARIFEPFFTTKEPGKGTGLGLATVFGIIKQHGGSLTVESEAGRGTTFLIYLRAEAVADPARLEAAAPPKLCGGTETILLVEDELAVRQLTRAVLEQFGYRVLEAADGVEALRIWEQNQDAIQLLYTDLVMPEAINGHELAARLQARNPRLPVIFTSGYSADIAGRELVLQARQTYLQKPSSPKLLLETVRRCLDS